MCGNCGCAPQHQHTGPSTADYVIDPVLEVEVLEDILARNDQTAAAVREKLTEQGTLGLNLMSSPGSGKTRLLEETAIRLGAAKMAVIEGDLETENDADRIRAHGVQAYQITTGMACHLEAGMVAKGLDHLQWQGADLLFIENVGNLICPATFDLGQHLNVVLLSTTEGADKAEKYPVMFQSADCVLITKSDLLPVLDDFDMDTARRCIRRINPKTEILTLSSKTGEGVESWLDWLGTKLTVLRTEGQVDHARL
ncbi:hydrogenase nickel incorporation protein HypB [Pseudovibrio sp. Tun.PSC04-5.I4]|uniref:hydrogenase nickel incorporation protein HypB n=1 Tax=Pseudovibrio sp. Tun.PSC04-5.I4 TaxID=1798213 RepID=UPI00087EE715|nr:hydrogenase nickel incorporation protein HypB [Pseudovibrio sp. Tun.PSC04-5.I4]SDQ12244.1 Hydrogenase nickel incorporation protein HypB [Pseudovibrio sp. Tun.PSC04-5.I4]